MQAHKYKLLEEQTEKLEKDPGTQKNALEQHMHGCKNLEEKAKGVEQKPKTHDEAFQQQAYEHRLALETSNNALSDAIRFSVPRRHQ